MPLTDAEKEEAKNSLALAIELNEPEAMIEGLRRMCERKGREYGSYSTQRGFSLISESEAHRWRKAAAALSEVLATLAPGNLPEPDKADYGAGSAQPEGAEHGRAAETRPEAGTPPAA